MAALFSVPAYSQSASEVPCDIKETPCVRFEVLGISQPTNEGKTYRIRVVNKCDDLLQHVVFQLPNGMDARLPKSESTYTAPGGREYVVRNPNAAPFHSIRFKATGAGLAKDSSDIFEYTLPPQAGQTAINAVARLAPQQYFETHLTVDGCKPRTRVTGHIRTENGAGIANVEVRVEGKTPAQDRYTLTCQTDNQGQYSFLIDGADTYSITPRRNDNHLNGVNTIDLVLITKHFIQFAPLDSPYKIIAADASNNRSIGAFDVVELRKLILLIIPELPNNTSWRFVDKSYVFPNPGDPFEDNFPETISGPHPNQAHDFIGVKIGDVNGSAVTN